MVPQIVHDVALDARKPRAGQVADVVIGHHPQRRSDRPHAGDAPPPVRVGIRTCTDPVSTEAPVALLTACARKLTIRAPWEIRSTVTCAVTVSPSNTGEGNRSSDDTHSAPGPGNRVPINREMAQSAIIPWATRCGKP